MRFTKPLRVLSASLVLVALTLLTSAASSASVPSDKPTTYGSGDASFTLTMPSGWRPKGDEDGFAKFSGPAKSFLWVQRQRSKIRKAELGPEELPRYYASKGYKLLDDRKATSLSGLTAGRFILLKTDAGVDWRYDVTDVFVDGMQWVVFAVAPRDGFDKVSGNFLSIYSSMRIAGSPGAPKSKAPSAVKAPVKKAAALTTVQGKPAAPDALSASSPAADARHSQMTLGQSSPVTPLLRGAETSPAAATPQPEPSPVLGKIAYEKAGEVWWADGALGRSPKSLGRGSLPSLSADGESLVFRGKDGKWVVAHLADGKLTKVALDARATHVVISPDGTQIAYAVAQKYLFGAPSSTVYVVDLSGKRLRELRDISVDQGQAGTDTGARALQADSCASPEFGPEPSTIIVDARIGGVWSAVSVSVSSGTSTGKVIAAGGQGARLSPDGSRIAYSRIFAGVRELWLSSLDGRVHEKLLVGVGEYAWSPDSSALLAEHQGSLETVSVASGVATPFIGEASHPASSRR